MVFLISGRFVWEMKEINGKERKSFGNGGHPPREVTRHNRPAAEMVSGSRGHGRSPGNGRSSPWAVTRQGQSPATGAGIRHGRLLATRGHPPRAITRHGCSAQGIFDFILFAIVSFHFLGHVRNEMTITIIIMVLPFRTFP
jgi:hypothetical protein